MKKTFLILLPFLLVLGSCSKAPGKTAAKLKLSLSGIVNLTNGVGTGGAILFGRSSAGEIFGKSVALTEETLDIPNGDWVFYAVMWDTASSATPMNGKAFCAKSVNKLTGGEATISLSLTNAMCADADFSGGKSYQQPAGVVRFADFFVDECDDINSASWFCGQDNHGSALSYRIKFQSFKKNATSPFVFGTDVITSKCQQVSKTAGHLLDAGMPVNFPSGNGLAPFAVSIELFLGSGSCSTTDLKGNYNVFLPNGLSTTSTPNSKLVQSSTNCTSLTYTADPTIDRNLCDGYIGDWNISTCNNVYSFVTRFAPASSCSISAPANPAIKQIISIPKPALCDRYLNYSAVIGAHPFAGGAGTLSRPYKICTEWQLNQIGEAGAPNTYNTSQFKLMNDLDMNKTDFGPYAKPACVGSSSMLDRHHNLNPIVAVETACGTPHDLMAHNGFQAVFNGNNKTISNARIAVEGVDANYIGFVRKLYGGAIVKNLNFKNLEVRGGESVGGVVGTVSGSGAQVLNINIEGLEVESKKMGGSSGTLTGGIAGSLGNGSKIEKVKINKARIRSEGTVGGIVGQNYGTILKTGYDGQIVHENSSNNYVGGIAGKNEGGGTIAQSYTKGFISSRASNVGGLVGFISTGSISNSYSTVSIQNSYNGASYIGGLAGSSSAPLNDVFFYGSLAHRGPGTPTMNAIVGNGSPSASNCFALAGYPVISGCSQLGNSNILQDGATITFGVNNPKWHRFAGTHPHLEWENHPCSLATNLASVGTQISAGRGSTLNPILICNTTQLSDILNRSQHFKLIDDINLSSWSPANPLFKGSFAGVFSGDNHSLYDLQIDFSGYNDGVDIIGFVGNLTGTFKDINFYNSTLKGADDDYSIGLLTGSNTGKIQNVHVVGSTVSGNSKVGGIAGENKLSTGLIDNVSFSYGNVEGVTSVGGIVGSNMLSAKIVRAYSMADLINTNVSYSGFGGIAGYNGTSALIDQVEFDGKIKFSSATTTAATGGIVGDNNSIVRNALFSKDASIETLNHTGVGGIVGFNQSGSSLETSIALGRVIVDNGGVALPGGAYTGAISGRDLGNTSNSFYISKSVGAYIGDGTTSVCTGSVAQFSGPPAFLTIASSADSDLFIPQSYFYNGTLQYPFIFRPTITTDGEFSSILSCGSGETWKFYKSYDPAAAGKTIAQIGDVNLYSAFDLAYDSGDPSTSINVNRMLEYYVAMMENRAPLLTPPIWEFDDGDGHLELLQIGHK